MGWLVYCSALSRRLLPEPQPQGSCAALGINGWLWIKKLNFRVRVTMGSLFLVSLSFSLSLFLSSCLFLRAFFPPPLFLIPLSISASLLFLYLYFQGLLLSLLISIWKWHFFFFFNAQLSPCLIVSKLPQSLLKIFCLTLMLTLSRELAPSQMPFPKGVGFLEGTLGESAAITSVCSQEYEVCVCASKRGACPKLQPDMDPLILWASLVPPQDAITKISRCLQTLKCLGRKPSLWVDAFKKSLNCCKQNPEAIPLPLRLSQRTWGGSPVRRMRPEVAWKPQRWLTEF